MTWGLIEFIGQLEDTQSDYGVAQALLFALLRLPQLSFEMLPIAALIGSLLGLGALASNSEIIVMRTAGLSVARLAGMVAVTGLVMMVFTALVAEFIGPPLDYFARNMRDEARAGYQHSDTGNSAWVKDGDVILHLDRVNTEYNFGGVYLYRFSDDNTLAAIARAENAGIDESLARFAPVMARAKADGVKVRGYVSTVLGCPYQGEVPLADVVRVARALHDMGCYEVSLGDTIGVGTPGKARAMLKAVAAEVPMAALAVHFHDTYGQALSNILACLEEGVRVVDAAVSGTGGCPYAKGASGNVASEDVVYMLHGMGIATGIDLERLSETGRWLAALLGRETGSKAGKAMAAT